MRVLLEGILWRFSGENRVSQIFEYVNREIEGKCIKMTLRFSCCEEIEGEFFDLLSPDGKLVLFKSENGKGFLAGLSKAYFTSPSQFFEYLSIANQNRMNNRMGQILNKPNGPFMFSMNILQKYVDGSQRDSSLVFIELDSLAFDTKPLEKSSSNLFLKDLEHITSEEKPKVLHFEGSNLTQLFKRSLIGKENLFFLMQAGDFEEKNESFMTGMRLGSLFSKIQCHARQNFEVNPFFDVF